VVPAIVDKFAITGDGSRTMDFGTFVGAPSMGASLTAVRNTSGSGNERGAALDLYAGSGGHNLRVWVDNPQYTGGVAPAIQINDGGGLYMSSWELISGHLLRSPPNPFGVFPKAPVTDPFMLGVWADVNAPSVVIAPNSGTTAGQPNFQNIVFLDGSTNERLAIDGAGTLQWSASITNNFAGSNWDTTLSRASAGMLATQSLRLSVMLQNGSTTFAALPPTVPNGAQMFCSDCVFGATNAPCGSGGSGAMAFMVSGAWIGN
jgi:hypothetical protein